MRRAYLAFVLLAAACGSAPAPSPPLAQGAVTQSTDQADAFALSIDIGRWGAMMSEVRGLTGVSDPSPADFVETDDHESPAALTAALRARVADFNRDRVQLCAAHKFGALTCASAYAPAWLRESAGVTPSLAEISRRSSALGDQVMPLWDAVCEDAATGGQSRAEICPME